MKCELDIYKDKVGEWRWHLTSPNGVIIGSANQSFEHKEDAKNNAYMDANGVNITFYADRMGEYRWRVERKNGQISHAASHGFSSEAHARQNVEDVFNCEKVEV